MARFGSFITVDLLAQTATGGIFSARRSEADGQAFYVVKVFVPDPAGMGPEGVESAIAEFLAAAEAQRVAGGRGDAGVVALHETGRIPRDAETEVGGAGAYYVTDLARRGSCERLTRGAMSVDARGLANIVRSTAQALAGLKDAAGKPRPHGNLHPNNILMMDDAPAALARVALTDLVSPAAATAMGVRGAARDLRALGEVIYRLVMRREYTGSWPIADSPQWQALGKTGGAWLELCNALLDRSLETSATPGLTAAQVLDRIPVDKPARSRRGLVVVGAAVLLLAGGGLLLYSQRTRPVEKFETFQQAPLEQKKEFVRAWRRLYELQQPRSGWADLLFQLGRERPDTRPEFEKRELEFREQLQAAAPEILEEAKRMFREDDRLWKITEQSVDYQAVLPPSEADLNELASEGGKSADVRRKWRGVSDEAIPRVQNALKAIEDFRDYVFKRWAPSQNIEDGAKALERMGSSGAELAKALREKKDTLKASLESPDRSAINDLIEFAKQSRESEGIAQAAGRIRSVLEEVTKNSGDGVSRAFSQNWAALLAQGEPLPAGDKAFGEAKRRLDEIVKLAEEMKAAWASSPSGRLSPEELAAALQAQKVSPDEAGIVTRDHVQSWIALVGGAHPGVKLAAATREIAQAIRVYESAGCKRSSPDPELERFSGRRAEIQRDVDAILAIPASSSEYAGLPQRAADGLKRAADLRSEIDSRTRQAQQLAAMSVEEVKRQLLEEARKATGSAAANEFLASRVTAIAAEASVDRCTLEERVIAWNRAMKAFETEVAKAPAIKSGDSEPWLVELASIASEAREASIRRILEEAQQAPPEVEAWTSRARQANEGIEARVRVIGELQASLIAMVDRLMQDFSAGEGAQSAGGLWDRAAADANRKRVLGEADEKRVQAAIEPIRRRIEAHRAIAGATDPAELLNIVRRDPPPTPDLMLNAWNRLTGAALAAKWPSGADDVAQIGLLLNALNTKAEAALAGSPERLNSAMSMIDAGARRAWMSLAARLADPGVSGERGVRAAGLAKVLDARESLRIAEKDIADPRVRMALFMRQFVLALDSAGEGEAGERAVEAATGVLDGQVRGLGASTPAVRNAAELVSKIQAEIAKGKNKKPVTDLGPGALGVKGEVLDDGARVVFMFGNEGIAFARFISGGVDCYIAETEVSIAQFVAAVRARGAIQQLGGAGWLPITADESEALWSGAQAWLWRKSLVVNANWLDPRMQQGEAMARGTKYTTEPAHFGGARNVDLPPGVQGSKPSSAMPMHRISADGAAAFCQLIGCKLPSRIEWTDALGAFSGDGPPNIRDRTFDQQARYADAARAKPGADPSLFPPPDAESYNPGNPGGGDSDQADDGHLYFREVKAGAQPGRAHDLIGNVAEYVQIDANQTGIIGGSALSKRGADTQAIPINLDNPFPIDVGVRPMFSAADAKPAALNVVVRSLLKKEMGEPPLLFE